MRASNNNRQQEYAATNRKPSVVHVCPQLLPHDMISLNSHGLCNATASNNPPSACRCAASVQDLVALSTLGSPRGLQTLPMPGTLRRDKDCTNSLRAVGSSGSTYWPLGLLMSEATLASMVLGPNPTLQVSCVSLNTLWRIFSATSAPGVQTTRLLLERAGNIMPFEGGTQRSLRSSSSSQWLWNPRRVASTSLHWPVQMTMKYLSVSSATRQLYACQCLGNAHSIGRGCCNAREL